MSDYPDLDCVFLNAGVQSQIRLSRPAGVDLDAFHQEISTNFNRLVDLSVKFLPHLLAHSSPTSLIFTGTLLAAVPAVAVPAYSASKAALNAYVLCLRRQHRGSNTKIIEIWPPLVQCELLTSKFSLTLPPSHGANQCVAAELHDYMGPEVGRSLGMPVKEFIDKTWEQLVAGEDLVLVGQLVGRDGQIKEITQKRRNLFESLSDMMLARFEL